MVMFREQVMFKKQVMSNNKGNGMQPSNIMKPTMRTIALLVSMTWLAGCTLLGPMYQRPEAKDVRLPEQFRQADDASAVQAPNQWWTLYQDAQLNALIEKAQQNNTNVQLAVARIEEADGYMREVGAALLPSVDLKSTGVRNRVTEAGIFPVFGQNPRSTYTLALNSSIELDFWGKVRRAKESARASYLSTQYAKETVLWSLSSLVANNYLIIRSLDSQLAVNKSNQAISEESLALTKRRLAGGVVSVLDVHQAELALDNLKSQQIELQRQRAISEQQLAVLTGELDTQIAVADLLTLPIPPIPPAGLPSSLMEARPDVRDTEQQLIAANANIGIAKAALYPSISLTGAYGGESVELGDLLKSAARVWSLGVSLNLPIFNAGRLDAKVDQATAKQKQALASYQGAVQTAFQEVNNALVNLRQYKSVEAIAQSKQETAKKILEVSQNRYKSGYSAYLEVLDAQRSYYEATQSFVQSRQNVLTASVDLFKALGGGWQPVEKAASAEPVKKAE
ncbi:efflux transporter, outer membrane factor lipoprotein, NodT family [Methylophilaceae bacterium 11]|nr:efflux transporter, outer membrane factor lipoprotein, NodT family [Methylophilaceae bacterium 11]